MAQLDNLQQIKTIDTLNIYGPLSLIKGDPNDAPLIWSENDIDKDEHGAKYSNRPGIYLIAAKGNAEGSIWYVSYIGKSEKEIGSRISEHISQYLSLRYNLYTVEALRNPASLVDYAPRKIADSKGNSNNTTIFKYHYSPSKTKRKSSLINCNSRDGEDCNQIFVNEYFTNFPNMKDVSDDPMNIVIANLTFLKVFIIPIEKEELLSLDQEQVDEVSRSKEYSSRLSYLEALLVRHFQGNLANSTDGLIAKNFLDNGSVWDIASGSHDSYEVKISSFKKLPKEINICCFPTSGLDKKMLSSIY